MRKVIETRRMKTALSHFAVFLGPFSFVALLQAPLSLPTGADPGHYLALARSFPVGLTYAPGVPFILSFFVKGADDGAFLSLKVLSSVFYAAMVYSFYNLALVASGDKRIAIASYLIAVFSVLHLESLFWGAYPQLLGLAFAFFGMASLVRWTRNTKSRNAGAAGVFFGASVLTHPTSALFGLAASVTYAVISRPPSLKALIKGLSLLALTFLPFGLGIIYFLLSLGPAPNTPLILRFDSGIAYWIFIKIFGGIYTENFVVMAVLLTLVSFSVVFERSREAFRLLVPLFVGAFILAFFVPSQFYDRLSWYLFFPVAATAGFSARVLTRPKLYRWLAVGGLLALYIGANSRLYSNSISYYDVLTENDLAAFAWLRQNTRPGDGVIVLSPTPITHGWWLESLAPVRAYIATDTYWWVWKHEVSRSTIAWMVLNGQYYIDAGRMKFIEGVPFATPAIFLYNGLNFYKVFEFSDFLMSVTFSPQENQSIIWRDSPYYAPIKQPRTWQISQSSVQWTSRFAWERASGFKIVNVTQGEALSVAYQFQFNKAIPRSASIRFIAPDAVTFQALSWNPPYAILSTKRQTGEVDEVRITVSTNATLMSAYLSPPNESGLSELRFDFSLWPTLSDFYTKFAVTVKGFAPQAPDYYTMTSLLQREGIRFILLTDKDQKVLSRLDADSHFILRERFGTIFIYEYLGRASP